MILMGCDGIWDGTVGKKKDAIRNMPEGHQVL